MDVYHLIRGNRKFMDHDRVAAFLNKAEITELINRYFGTLDQKEFDV